MTFEDGTGEVIREETIPVFVDAEQRDAQQALGERVVDGETVSAKPDADDLRTVMDAETELRTVADRYVSARVTEIKSDLRSQRHAETTRELENRLRSRDIQELVDRSYVLQGCGCAGHTFHTLLPPVRTFL